MKKYIELKDFCIKHLHVDWFFSEEMPKKVPKENPFIDYVILRNPENSHEFSMTLTIEAISDKEPKVGSFLVKATLMGLFTFTKESKEEEMQYLIRVNGATILYGLLRGHLATITGAFPKGGKYILPSIYMQEIIPKIEKRKTKAKSPRKKKS